MLLSDDEVLAAFMLEDAAVDTAAAVASSGDVLGLRPGRWESHSPLVVPVVVLVAVLLVCGGAVVVAAVA